MSSTIIVYYLAFVISSTQILSNKSSWIVICNFWMVTQLIKNQYPGSIAKVSSFIMFQEITNTEIYWNSKFYKKLQWNSNWRGLGHDSLANLNDHITALKYQPWMLLFPETGFISVLEGQAGRVDCNSTADEIIQTIDATFDSVGNGSNPSQKFLTYMKNRWCCLNTLSRLEAKLGSSSFHFPLLNISFNSTHV